MALERLNRVKEKTLGLGNCAYNAFALGFCHSSVLNLLERQLQKKQISPDQRFKRFISLAANALAVAANWKSVKERLLYLRLHDKELLQTQLAPVLRSLSVDIALKKAAYAYHFRLNREIVLATFEQYKLNQAKEKLEKELEKEQPGMLSAFFALFSGQKKTVATEIAKQTDDIFTRHEFIMKQFDQHEDVASFAAWWQAEGYEAFLQAMRQDGVWAGDLELCRLAGYFEVVLNVVYGDSLKLLQGNYGYFPFLFGDVAKNIAPANIESIMECLYSREVIQREPDNPRENRGKEFIMPSLNLIYRRLDNIPDYEMVSDYIWSHGENLKFSQAPSTWPRACLQEMIQRNVINGFVNKNPLMFLVDADAAIMRISAIDNLEEVKEICRTHYQLQPVLVLCNEGCGHWENSMQKLIEDAFRLFPVDQPLLRFEQSGSDLLRKNSAEAFKRFT